MAAYSVATAAHKTLTGTTVDTVTITGAWPRVEVLNRSGTADLTVTNNGTTPTAAADDAHIVPAGTSLNIPVSATVGSEVIKVLGNANAYSVIGTDEV